MRALLVVNPAATATTEKVRDILVCALTSDLDIQIEQTGNRGHAAALACRAARSGMDLVIAFGGDGTVNEVVNGLLTDGPRDDLPALAIVPGGSTNVFARTLGMSNNPVDATAEILTAIRAKRTRPVGLGKADDRWFTFAAGFGFDAEVVGRVEKLRRKGQESTVARYLRTIVTQFFMHTNRRNPAITLHKPGEPSDSHIFFAVVCNTNPYTYLREKPVQITPKGSFDTGLDIFAPKSMGALRMTWYSLQALRSKPRLRGRRLIQEHNLQSFTLTANRPVSLHVDGDYLGERTRVLFEAHDNALTLVM